MKTISGLPVPDERVVAESLHSFALALQTPLSNGHVVCLPKRPCAKQTDMTADEFCDLYDLATKLGKAFAEHHKMTGVTYIVNDRDDGGKEVAHVSLHVIPRVEGDFKGDSLSDILEQKPAFGEGLRETTSLDEITPELAERAASLRAIVTASN